MRCTLTTDPAKLRDVIGDADAILLAPRFGALLRELLPFATKLRWIHALGAGVETLPFDLLRERPHAIVTNSAGLYADGLAEWVIAAILWFAKDLRRLATNQLARKWEPFTVQRIEGLTLGIVGLGGIGRAIARRAAALGMSVIATRRHTGRSAGETTIVALDDLLPRAHYVVLSTPLTPETRQLIDAPRLRSMRPEAVLINVSRGDVVDEAALVDALRETRIRGAALDVYQTEPLPESSALWGLENVLLSPHTADRTADSHDRAMTFFFENLQRFQAAEPLVNIIDLDAGY